MPIETEELAEREMPIDAAAAEAAAWHPLVKPIFFRMRELGVQQVVITLTPNKLGAQLAAFADVRYADAHPAATALGQMIATIVQDAKRFIEDPDSIPECCDD